MIESISKSILIVTTIFNAQNVSANLALNRPVFFSSLNTTNCANCSANDANNGQIVYSITD